MAIAMGESAIERVSNGGDLTDAASTIDFNTISRGIRTARRAHASCTLFTSMRKCG
jgi:hypothetical protein